MTGPSAHLEHLVAVHLLQGIFALLQKVQRHPASVDENGVEILQAIQLLRLSVVLLQLRNELHQRREELLHGSQLFIVQPFRVHLHRQFTDLLLGGAGC